MSLWVSVLVQGNMQNKGPASHPNQWVGKWTFDSRCSKKAKVLEVWCWMRPSVAIALFMVI